MSYLFFQKYFDYNNSNSVGLVQTLVTIVFTSTVQSRPLASTIFGSGINTESTGWANRNQLHVLSATSLTNSDCQSRIPGWNHFIYSHTLCVLAAPGNRICDSGNPLIAANQIVGVQAWEPRCDEDLPSMHERVAHFRDWIVGIAI